MKDISGVGKKRISSCFSLWQWVLATSLFATLFVASLPCDIAFASSSAPLVSTSSFSISPMRGPVGALVTVTGSNLTYANGTRVDFGYVTALSTCNSVASSQPGFVFNHAFSGWLRWPAGSGTGTFSICLMANGSSSFLIAGSYQVLSDFPPQVSVAPTVPDAGKQANVSGTNFLPGGTGLSLFWKSVSSGQSIPLGSVVSDEAGAFSHTFTVPSNANTGSYTLSVLSSAGIPSPLEASTTFQVNGITISPIASPTVHTSPTAVASPTASTQPTATPTTVPQPEKGNSGALNKTSPLLLPIVLGGLFLIIVALIVGIILVRRQRAIAEKIASASTLVTEAVGPGGDGGDTLALPAGPAKNRFSGPAVQTSINVQQSMELIPFDPALADAMRQAQVGLFATPRPPVDNGVPL